MNDERWPRSGSNQEQGTKNQELPKTPALQTAGFFVFSESLSALASWREPPIKLGECFVPDFNLPSWRSWRLGVPIKKNHAKTLRRQLELKLSTSTAAPRRG